MRTCRSRESVGLTKRESAMTFAPDRLERYAIRCARGNNGGEWATHYTEDQKNFWRRFVRDLIADIDAEHPKATSKSASSGLIKVSAGNYQCKGHLISKTGRKWLADR